MKLNMEVTGKNERRKEDKEEESKEDQNGEKIEG